MVSLASEFPNDNPALHRGVIWVNTEPTGGARPERAWPPSGEPPREPAPITLRSDDEPPPTLDHASSSASALAGEPDEGLPPTVDAASEDATEHPSLAPPEDDEVDESPIVVEELEPIEAHVEGESTRDAAALAMSEGSAPALADMSEGSAPAPAESGVVLVTAGRPVTSEAPPPPAPAESEVVLSATRAESTERDDASGPLTPVFEEVAASEIPRETTSLPPAPDDPFTVLVCTLADVAISAGSPHVASLLPGLLFDGRLTEPLEADVAEALRVAGLWDGSQVAPSFVAITAGWKAILRGTSNDFDACGAAMLDEWSADLLARLLAAPARAPMLRQELRSRGIAAFGLAA